MTILYLAGTGCATFAAGAWAGVRWTARNIDRLLAVMPDDQVVTAARKARAHKALREASAN